MGKFQIRKRSNNEFQFDLKAVNGHIILTSESYKTKESCKEGINSVKKNSKIDARFKQLIANDGKPYFNLKAANGEIIGTSETYESTSSCKKGIASVKKNAPDASIIDLTDK